MLTCHHNREQQREEAKRVSRHEELFAGVVQDLHGC